VNRETPHPSAPDGRLRRMLTIVGDRATDIAVGVMWAALVVAIVLFSGAVSQFVYVDF